MDPSLQRAQTMLARLGETNGNVPRGQVNGHQPVVTPSVPPQPTQTNIPVNAQNLRSNQWESAPRDAGFGSYRQPTQENGLERFPSLEPPVRGDMKRMPAF